MYLLQTWGGGLFLLPVITVIGAIIFFIQAYKASKSNSTTQVGTGTSDSRVVDNTGNVPITKTGQFWFAVVLAIATIVIIIMVNADK